MSRARQIKDALAWLHRLTHPPGARRGDAQTQQVFIFCYHRINTKERNPLGVDRHVFAEQLDLFASSGGLLSPETFFQFLRREVALPSAQNFLVTFDDGYVSSVDAAMPLLQKAGARALSFLATDLLGKESSYSPDMGKANKERILTVAEVKATRSAFLYQSHGHRHIDYRHSSREDVLADLSASLGWFERELGYRPFSVAYPFGLTPRWANWQEDFKQTGVGAGFVTGSHPLRVRTNGAEPTPLLALPRVGYLTDETLTHTRARLSGGLTLLRMLDAPWLRRIKSGRRS
jgi:peptidoglycan/xylan/chitin deacetylase (PgdA/CDA1 family)